jgi:AraC-like DNA-binding protein
MLGALEAMGFDLDRLLKSAGLRRGDVENPDAYLSPIACAAVFESAAREGRVPNLALQLALRTPVGTTPLLDYLLVSSESVGHGLARLARYLRLVEPGIRLAVREEDDPVRVVVERSRGPFETELTVALSILRFTQETDGALKVAHASFRHRPGDVAEFEEVLRCPVRTRASWDGWALSRSAARLPLRRRDPVLRRWLEQQAAEILARLPASGGVCDEVRRALSAQVAAGELQLEVVARRLATTPRTLQRRLARAGTTFEALCDDARRQAAETYLSDPTLTVAEVTYLLGYSEPAAFHRAFKRWSGSTPQAFRARRRSAGKLD